MNVTKTVWSYLDSSHLLRRCIAYKVVSFSRLARHLMAELNLPASSFDAVLVACRRYPKPSATPEGRILGLLRKTNVTVISNISVIVADRYTPPQALLGVQNLIKRRNGSLHLIEGQNSITLITNDEFMPLLKKSLKQYMQSGKTGLVEIVLKSPQDLERTPGFVAHLYSLLADRGINIVEEMSCWTDTIIVIEKKDVEKAMALFYSSGSSSSSSFFSSSFFSSSSSASS
ncbi:MAG: hypothetical protein V1735_06130 [Nanoarchaeota archaeon]